uniref:Uncharacterized protein n=1 Tax=Ciona savignyi TaxID=51511 RepID=H2YP15_CIOSA
MEHKEMWAALLRITEKSSNSYLRIAQALDHARMHVHQSEKTHPGVRKMNNQRQENKGEVGKALTEVETSVRLTRDYMMKIQNILQRSSNRPQNLQSDRKDRG